MKNPIKSPVNHPLGDSMQTTTIVVDKVSDVGESNAIMISEEVLEILPINSKEGQLFQFVDKKKKKGALLRLKPAAANANPLGGFHVR